MVEIPGQSSGINPGAKPVWQTGSNSPSLPVNQPPGAQTTGGVRGVPARVAPSRPGEVTAPTTPQPGGSVVAPAPREAVARQITIEDVRAHLLNNLQINPTDANTKLASSMLKNGLELSRANFVSIMNMLQGTDKSQSMQEAAILLLMKGIDSPQAVKVLGQYFSENPGLAAQFLALQEGVGNLISALGMGQGLLNASLVAQLSSLLSQFDQNFEKLSRKLSGERGLGQDELLNNVRALKALLQGVQDKAPLGKGAQANNLAEGLAKFQNQLDGVMQNLLAQAILSNKGRSEVNYVYQQIPNIMGDPPRDLEIVVKRDGEGKQSIVDPRNTEVVMSLETENLGKIVVSMIIKDKKVYLIFVFSEKDQADQGRSSIASQYGELVKKLANQNYLVTGYQVKKDPIMCKIRPYLIPMLSSLEEHLKRIDLEA